MSPIKYNDYFQYLFPVKQITYPTPPYMIIRREGIEDFQLTVRSRKLMDMIKKFDPNDISYIDDSSFVESLPQTDITSIRDPLNKYFVINGNTVWAKPLQGSNIQLKAKFMIAVHNTEDMTRPVITLQVQDQDLYLSYEPNADRQLKVLPLGQRRLDFRNSDIRGFFFYLIEVANRKYSFKPVKEQGWFISTSPDSNSRVTVTPASDNSRHTVFAFDPNFIIGPVTGSGFNRPGTDKTSRDDEIFQDRHQSFLAREDYIMDATSLDNPYRWPRQDNHYQSNYLGWQYMCK